MGIFPWIEIGCEGKKGDFDAYNQTNPLTGKKPSTTIGADGTVVVATQNGYQMIWAGKSKGSEIAAREREMKKEAEKLAEKMKDSFKDLRKVKVEAKDKKKEKPEDEPDSAPLMAGFFLLVIAAVAVGFAMPPGLMRTLIFGGTLSAAVLVLVIQTAIGFPIKEKWDEQKEKQKKALGMFADRQTSGPKEFCRVTIWYYLTWPFLLIPLGLVGTEELLALTAGGGKKKSKRRAYDEDEDEEDRPRRRRRDDEDEDRPRARRREKDEDEEDDEDRPRRRQRTEEDAEEPVEVVPIKKRRNPDEDTRTTNDRPRKKARAEEDEDEGYTDERPRKKSRVRDEDEEDERPRKKKARRYDDDD
jgi:hypothetical protein